VFEPAPDPFSPLRLGALTLRNRFIRSGCFEGMCQGGQPTEALVEHHRAVAAGGAAMTTVAYCAVSADGRAYGHEMWMRPEVVPDLRRLTDAVHREGAAASLQIGHCGFFADPRVIGGRPLGASRVFNLFRLSWPRPMTASDMDRVAADFARAALLAREAGFDAVEVHAGHGYLLSQFLSPWTNRRRDAFGGPLAARLAFPARTVAGVRAALGPDFPILVKTNLYDGFRGGFPRDEAAEAARAFEAAGATALIPSCGFTSRTPLLMLRGRVPVREMVENQRSAWTRLGLRLFGRLVVRTYPYRPLFLLDEARAVVEAVRVPVVLVGGVGSLAGAQAALGAGFAAVAMGRALIRDPDLIRRMERGESDGTDCDLCNRCVAAMDAGGVRCVTRTDGPL
jgi:2,4-dienoyl-CoA reductase-like NADH-dependent reductase (Old Yellow Enzyme family)